MIERKIYSDELIMNDDSVLNAIYDRNDIYIADELFFDSYDRGYIITYKLFKAHCCADFDW